MTKLSLTALIILVNQILFAQQLLKCNESLTDINLVCEYFANLDSAFAAKNKVNEIKVTESYSNHGRIKYERTTLNFRYDKLFKKTYSEINSWAEDGILSRGDIVVDFKDSIIHSQLYRSSYDTNKGPLIVKYVTKLVWLNDTLLKRNSYSYINDSLYKSEDLGIEDTRSEYRRLEKLRKIPDEDKVVVFPDKTMNLEPEPFYVKDHEDIIIKDSLGRITETESFFVTTINDQRGSFPGQKCFIEYLDSTKIIRSVKAFNDFNTNKGYFEEIIKAGLNNSWDHFWPKNYIHNNLYFEYTASNFKFGIPQQVVISLGKDATTQRIYKTIILTR